MLYRQNRKIGLQHKECFSESSFDQLDKNDRIINNIDKIKALIIIVGVLFSLFYFTIIAYGTIKNLNIEFDDGGVSPMSVKSYELNNIETLEISDVFNNFESFLSLIMGDVDFENFENITDEEFLESITEIIDYVNDTYPDINEENFFEYFNNGTLTEILDDLIDEILNDLVYDFSGLFWKNALMSFLNVEQYNQTNTIRIVNNNDGFYSFIKYNNVFLDLSLIINEIKVPIFIAEKDVLSSYEEVSGSYNLASIFLGIIDPISDVFASLTTDFILNYTTAGEEMISELMNDVMMNIFDYFNIKINLNFNTLIHYLGVGFNIEFNISDVVNQLSNNIFDMFG